MNGTSLRMGDDFEAQAMADKRDILYRIRYHVATAHRRRCQYRCRRLLFGLAVAAGGIILLVRVLRPGPGRLAILELLLTLCFTAALVAWALMPGEIRTVHTDREGLLGMHILPCADGLRIVLHGHTCLAEDARIFERARLHALMSDPARIAQRIRPISPTESG